MALHDIYGQTPFNPAQRGADQIGKAFESAPGLAMSRLQQQEAETVQGRANRPVTPWQKAIMRLMAGEDPARVAADTKAETQGAPSGAPPAQGQMPIGAAGGMSGAAGILGGANAPGPMYGPQTQHANMQMPPAGPGFGVQAPMTGQQDRDTFAAQMTGGQMPGDMSGMGRPSQGQLPPGYGAPQGSPQGQGGGLMGISSGQGGGSEWQGRGGMTEQSFEGMNGRDYLEYVDSMGKANQAKVNRDWLAEQRLRNEGAVEKQKVANKGKVDVENIRSSFKDKNLTSLEKRKELERRLKDKEIDERTANHIAEIELGYAKIREAKQQFDRAFSQKDRLAAAELLVKREGNLMSAFSRVEASLTGIVGMGQEDLVEDLAEKRRFILEAKEAADAELAKVKGGEGNEASGSVSGKRTEGPAGAQRPGTKQYKYKGNDPKVKRRLLDATPAEFDQAVKDGKIVAADWE